MHRLLFLLLFPAVVYGQTAQETVGRKLQLAKEQFNTSNESNFVVATPYIKNYVGVAGSPFWATDVWSSAEVMFKGTMYQVSELKYDCANDIMVIPRYSDEGVQLLTLIPSLYTDITINKKFTGNQRGMLGSETPVTREHFIFYSATKDEKSDGVPSGYYHYVIEKPVSLLCKYASSVVERNGQKIFEQEVKYFIQKEDKLLRIHRVGSLVEVFPLLKDKINSFAEQNSINTLLSLDYDNVVKLIEFINLQSTK